MSVRNSTAYQTRIQQIAFGLLFVAATAVAIRSLMFGAYSRAGLVIGSFLGFWLVVALKEWYWLLFPFFVSTGISIPGLPFEGGEIGCLVVIVAHFMRLASKQDKAIHFNSDLLVVFPVFFWILFVFFLNPVGMAMIGSNTIGGRYYFQIVVSFFAMLALSTQHVDEKGAKRLFYVLLFGMTYQVLVRTVLPSGNTDEDFLIGDSDIVSSRYGFIGCANIYMLLFARYSISDFLRVPWRAVCVAILALFATYSGKRRAFGTLLVVPVFRSFLVGKEKALTVLMAGLVFLVLCLAVMGDGTMYRLPPTAQRALSVVFPTYQTGYASGMNDFFRAQMREQARVIISDNPWFGRKGFAMNLDETAWMHFGGANTDLYEGHAYAGNWHSTWYAFAADFGLPCVILWGIFVCYLLRYLFVVARNVSDGKWRQTVCLFYCFQLLTEIVFSYTSGHSSRTPLFMWPAYGMLIAISNGSRKSEWAG